MRKIILVLVMMAFYAVGLLQMHYEMSRLISIIVGVAAAAVAICIDQNMWRKE